MPRSPLIRSEYSRDVATLARVGRAVSADTARPAEWRLQIVKRLNECIALMQADSEKRLTLASKAAR
jgi:hypothetical protein